MKKVTFMLFAFLLGISVLSCNQNTEKGESQSSTQTTNTPVNPVEGAWKLVWAQYNDTLADMSNHVLVKMFADGAFSLFAHDSSGKMKYTGYGKYEFEGNRYLETFIYHNSKQNWGGKDWQNLEVKGDTMYMNGFTKMIIGGKEVTDYPKIREKLIRVKW